MKQTGTVTRVAKDGIKVSVTRSTACGDSCASCSAKCELKNTSIVAEYRDDVKEGDKVIFEMETGKVMKAAVLVYIMPIFILLLGYGAGVLIKLPEEKSVILGVGVMAVWFVIMHFWDKKVKNNYKHRIIEITGEDADVRL